MKGRSVAVMIAVMAVLSVGEAVVDLPESIKCPTICLHVCGGYFEGCKSDCEKHFCKESKAKAGTGNSVSVVSVPFLPKCPNFCIQMCVHSKYKHCGSACEQMFCILPTETQTKV